MRIEKFEDINAWQEARTLVKMIYNTIKKDDRFSKDYRFRE